MVIFLLLKTYKEDKLRVFFKMIIWDRELKYSEWKIL